LSVLWRDWKSPLATAVTVMLGWVRKIVWATSAPSLLA
jgi:hypothetical protein